MKEEYNKWKATQQAEKTEREIQEGLLLGFYQ